MPADQTSLSIGLKPLLELSEQLDDWLAYPHAVPTPFDTRVETNLRYLLAEQPEITVEQAHELLEQRLLSYESLRPCSRLVPRRFAA